MVGPQDRPQRLRSVQQALGVFSSARVFDHPGYDLQVHDRGYRTAEPPADRLLSEQNGRARVRRQNRPGCQVLRVARGDSPTPPAAISAAPRAGSHGPRNLSGGEKATMFLSAPKAQLAG